MGLLLDVYRKHFGGAHSLGQLYTGFAVFFFGGAMSFVGIMLVLTGDLLIEDPQERFKLGIFLAALGLPLIFSGIQLTLPSSKWIHALVGIGALTCIWGVALFNQVYPDQWDRAGEGASIDVIRVYTAGLVILMATTAMALVINFISKRMTLPGQELDDIFADPDKPVSMEEILRDIEREVSRQKLSWGGLDDGGSQRRLIPKVAGDFGPGAEISSGKAGLVTETPLSEGQETAYKALLKMRGRDVTEADDTDDTKSAVAALVALKRARQQELERSWWYRFKRWIVSLFTGRRPTIIPEEWEKANLEERAPSNVGTGQKASKGGNKGGAAKRGAR